MDRGRACRMLAAGLILFTVFVSSQAGGLVSGSGGGEFHRPSLAPPPERTGMFPSAATMTGPHPAGFGSSYVSGGTVLGTAVVKDQPSDAVYDAGNHYLYVTDFGAPILGGNSVTIINDRNDTAVTTVPVGDDPISSVYAPSTGDVYTLNFGTSNNLTVFHGTSIVDWIPVGTTPHTAIYDPANTYIYVSNQASHNLTVVNGTTTVGSIQTGSYPGVAAYDNRTECLYVPNFASNNVTVVNGTSVVATLNVGTNPESAIYDPSNGWVYVPNPGSNNVTILNGTATVATVQATVAGGGGPAFGAYDPANGFVYLADQTTNTVYILNGTSFVANISVGIQPRAVVYDPADSLLYVPSWFSDSTSVINGTTVVATVAVGTNPYGLTYDPDVRSVYVDNFNSANLSQIGTPSPASPVTFAETGLPSGTTWTVDFNATQYATNRSTVGFPAANGSFNYTVSTIPGYAATVPSGVVPVAGAAIQVNVTFAAAYPVRFTESGLGPGTYWTVGIGSVRNGSGNGSMDLWELNGTYTYTIQPEPGYFTNWSGRVTVAGGPVPVNITFGTSTYAVWFNETGLPVGTSWGATLGSASGGSTNASFAILVANGSYLFAVNAVPGYLGTPSVGPVSVVGSGASVRVAFVRAYPVKFLETGLPNGTSWTITFGSGPTSSTASNFTVPRPNGTFAYSASTPDFQFIPVAPHGSFNVSGGATMVTVPFVLRSSVATTFWLYFNETGLPTGTRWNVTLGNATASNTTESIRFLVTNATYPFTVAASGYVPTPSQGLVVANGPASAAAPIRIAFRPFVSSSVPAYPISFTAGGLPANVSWAVSIGSATVSGIDRTHVLNEPNGTYTFDVRPIGGYVTNWSGLSVVNGVPVLEVIDFHPFLNVVAFQESGLPAGSSWNVSVGTVANSSSGPLLTVALPNGTYAYPSAVRPGSPLRPGGSFVLSGSGAMVVDLAFGSPRSPSSTIFGLPPIEALGIAIVVAVALVVAGDPAACGSGR